MQKIYKIKVKWFNYFFTLLIYMLLCVIIILPYVIKYSEIRSLFIFIGLFLILLKSLTPILAFGYKVKIDQETLNITEEFFGIVYRIINIRDIVKFHYKVVKYASGSTGIKFYSEINYPVNIRIVTTDNRILQRKLFISESDLLDMIRILKEIRSDIDFSTNSHDYAQYNLHYSKPVELRALHKEKHFKYLPILFLLGLGMIFVWMIILIKILST